MTDHFDSMRITLKDFRRVKKQVAEAEARKIGETYYFEEREKPNEWYWSVPMYLASEIIKMDEVLIPFWHRQQDVVRLDGYEIVFSLTTHHIDLIKREDEG